MSDPVESATAICRPPGRGWVLFAALFALALVLAGPGTFVLGLLSATGSREIARGRFASGETSVVRLSPDVEQAIFATDDAGGPCRAAGPGAAVIGGPGETLQVMGTDGRTWRLLASLAVRKAGEYEVVCGEPGRPAWYSIVDRPSAAGCLAGCLGGLAALFVLPLVGIVGGAATAAVAWSRRRPGSRALPTASALEPERAPAAAGADRPNEEDHR